MAYMNVPQRILQILYQTLVLSVVDYGFGLLTLSKTQLARLEVVQNQGMRTILGCTRATSCEAIRHVLDLVSMPEQVQAYLKVSADQGHPLHSKVGSQSFSPALSGAQNG